MALGETLAHANYLVAEGSLVREEDRGRYRYRRAVRGACNDTTQGSLSGGTAAVLNIPGSFGCPRGEKV
jgi:hypothetical protein